MRPPNLPSPAPVLDLIEAFRRSKTMFTAVELGVFDRLREGGLSVSGLATATGTQPEPLGRLLNGCVALGLLETNGAVYRNTAIADTYLCRESPQTLAGYILYSNRALFKLWANLEDALREGAPRWQQTFGLSGSLFANFFNTEESARTFLAGMHGLGLLGSPSIVRVFNLNRFQHLVDLGGGTGHLTIAACERYGNLRGTIFDLPDAVPHARRHVEGSAARDRIQVVAGDFFRDPLPPADLFAVSRILHDWNDATVARILSSIYAALPDGGAILIAEGLLDDDSTGPVPVLMQSLNMLCCTEGRERTVAEYERLLQAAGFSQVEARRTGAPLDAIMAVKSAT